MEYPSANIKQPSLFFFYPNSSFFHIVSILLVIKVSSRCRIKTKPSENMRKKYFLRLEIITPHTPPPHNHGWGFFKVQVSQKSIILSYWVFHEKGTSATCVH